MDRSKKNGRLKHPKNLFDRIDVTSRLINIILDMSLHQQIELLKKIDKSQFPGARKHVRKPYVFVVDCETHDAYTQEYIRDISGGGLFLRSEKVFSDGEEVRMTFQVPNHPQLFHILGKVVRVCKDGVGIKFIRHIALDGKPNRTEAESLVETLRSA